MIRIVAQDNRLIPDRRRRLPGRGGYLHPETGCLQQAVKRRAFGRALRKSDLDSTGFAPDFGIEIEFFTGSASSARIPNLLPAQPGPVRNQKVGSRS